MINEFFCLWIIVTNILKLCKTSSVCPTIGFFFGRNWLLNLGNFIAIACHDIYSMFCRSHFTLTSWPMSFLLMDYCYLCIEVVQDAVRLSDDPFIRPKLVFELRQVYCNNLSYILCFVDRTSLWLFDQWIVCLYIIVTSLLKLCKTSPVCPTIRLFGQKSAFELS